MKRRTNAQWIVYALAAFLIGGICLYAGAKYVLKRHVQSWKRDGIAASIAGDNEKAVELLGQFLRYQPGDMDALVYYVKSRELVPMAHSQHLAETVRALRRILDEDPSRVDDRRHLLELYCKLDRGPEALDTANEILRKIPNDARTLQLKAEMLMRMSRDQEAMDTVAKWITAAPTDIQPRMMQIALDTKAGQSSDAIIAGADDLRRRHPGDPRFELLEGFAYEAAGNQALAVQWLQSAAGHPQLPPDVVQPLIQQLDNVGMSRQSLALLQRMLQQSGDPSIREQLAHRLWETERWSEVVSTLSGLDPSDRSADATLLAMKAMALARLKATGAKVADPAPYVAALSARDEPVAHAWSKMLSRQGNEPAGNDRDLAAALTAAVSEDPGNPYLLFFLGETYLRLGEADLAESAFRRSSDVDISWSMPAVRLVDTMLQKGQPSEAFDVATMSLRRNPNNAATVIALASAWSAGVEAGTVGNVDRLLQLVGDAQAQMPNDQRIGLIKAQLLAEEGQVDQARAAVRSLMVHKPPPDESVYISLATLSWKTGMGIEQECFDQCRRVHGISPDLAYAETVDRFEVNHDDELPFFDSLAKQAGATSDMKWRLARVKYLDLTNAPSAPAEWKSLGEAYPNDLGVQEAMMSAQTLQGNWDIMEPTIERVRALTGDDALEWRLAGAKLLVTAPRTQDDVEKGALRLDDLIQKYPQLPEAHVFLAKALVQMKRVDGAIEQLSIASKLAPTSVPIALELASLLQSQGDFDRVQQELDRVTPQLQTESQRQQAAMILSKQNDAAGAATILERPAPVSASPADRDQSDLFLAMLYRQQHQYDRAEQISARLMQHPSPQIVQFVASLYTSEGKIDQANQALAALDNLKLAPGIKDAMLGTHFAEMGDLKDAASHFQAAVTQDPTRAGVWRLLADCNVGLGQMDLAVSAINSGAKANPNDKGLQTLQQQSSLLARAGAEGQLRPVVGTIVRDPLNSDTNIELLQIMLDGFAAHDNEMIVSRLDDLIERHPDNVEARLQLVQTYVAMERFNDALSAARRAMTDFAGDPRAARAAMEICRDARLWRDLQSTAQELKRRSPGDGLAADTAIAMAMIAQDDASDAINQLSPYLDQFKADPKKYSSMAPVYAAALANNGQTSAAAQWLWPLVTADPYWRHIWIDAAKDLPSTTDAVAWLDKVAAIIPPDAVFDRVNLALAYDIVGRRASDPKLTQKGADMVATIAQSPAANADALQAAGMLMEAAGNWKQAEDYYRQALAKSTQLFSAANNLAMLLVRHGGDAHEALNLMRQAVQQDPRTATIYDSLAAVEEAASDPNAAVDSETTATKLQPDNLTWQVRLAGYLLDAGNRPASARMVENMDLHGFSLSSLTPTVQSQLADLRKRLKHAQN